MLQKWVRAWFVSEKNIPEEYEDVRPDLLPAVRGRAYYDVTRLRLQLAGNTTAEWPYQPLGEHLSVGLVYDMHEAMLTIRQEGLDNWGVTFYEAMEAARENLAQLQHACDRHGTDGGPEGAGEGVERLELRALD